MHQPERCRRGGRDFRNAHVRIRVDQRKAAFEPGWYFVGGGDRGYDHIAGVQQVEQGRVQAAAEDVGVVVVLRSAVQGGQELVVAGDVIGL